MGARWAINEDAENEFRYWMHEFLSALRQGAVFALLAGLAIALAPRGGPHVAFAHDFWTYLVEIAFWFGVLLAMLWSAVKRALAFLTGVLPWDNKPYRAERRAQPR